MTRERWGTFSVIDHTQPGAFIPELLLYDRLVIPVPVGEAERMRWRGRGWDPELLDRMLTLLDDRVLRVPWDEHMRELFKQRLERIRAVRADADMMLEEVRQRLPYQLTRRILANDRQTRLPAGVTHVVTVMAYQSRSDFRADYLLEVSPGSTSRAELGLLLRRRTAFPIIPRDSQKAEELLNRALELATDPDFQAKRRRLYDWQEDVIERGIGASRAMQELDQMVNGYNRAVERALRSVYYKFVFTIVAAAVGAVGAALGAPLAGVGALIAVVRFAAIDRTAPIQAGESEPAAMFHDVEAVVA